MAGGGRKPLEGAKELATDVKDTGTGGHQPTGLLGVFQGGGTGSTHIQVGDVGDNPLYGNGPGVVSTQSLQED